MVARVEGFYGRTLLEDCSTLLFTGSPINTYIEDLRMELLRGHRDRSAIHWD